MQSVEVEHAELVPYGQGDHWHVALNITQDDGEVIRHLVVFPTWTLEARAAEYGLTDTAEIVGMILAEPFLPSTQGVPAIVAEPDYDAAVADQRARVDGAREALGFTDVAARVPNGKDAEHPLGPIVRQELDAELVARLARQLADTRIDYATARAGQRPLPFSAGDESFGAARAAREALAPDSASALSRSATATSQAASA